MASAKVIADSTNIHDNRLITVEATFHRFVLAEFNTHRVFSRNSASSRAIPVSKQIKAVVENTAMPVEFGTNQKGMQAGPPLQGEDEAKARLEWEEARDAAVRSAEKLLELGVHKQVTNRLLEPFMWHTVIVTSTEWENFFAQRCSPLAQPEIREAAEAIRNAIYNSEPQLLRAGEFHLPYIQDDEGGLPIEDQIKISAARCARVSYLTHDGKRDLEADLMLFDRLVTADPPHWSPLEHIATPCDFTQPLWYAFNFGNFEGWRQLRHNLALFTGA